MLILFERVYRVIIVMGGAKYHFSEMRILSEVRKYEASDVFRRYNSFSHIKLKIIQVASEAERNVSLE